MATSFDKKIEILATMWITMKDEMDSPFFQEVLAILDVGCPLASFVYGDLITELSDQGKGVIEETWNVISKIFELDENYSYESMDDLMEWFDENVKPKYSGE
jgi:hypothetical protein